MQISKETEITKRGLKYSEIFYPKKELIETLNKLQELPLAQKEYSVHQMKLEDAVYDAKKFLSYYYNLQKIPYLKIKRILAMQIHTLKYISPFDLPISLISNEDIFSGSVTEIITNTEPHLIFRGINLSTPTTEHTSASYIHEITHTQLDRLKGIVNDYFNLEVLSIFNELFHTSILTPDERLLRLNDSRRIYEMNISAKELLEYHNGTSQMSKDEVIDCCKYLISGLKAYNLFITFYYANNELKNNILDDIQSIFDGYLTLEEMLDKYEITLDSSQDYKKLHKYFSR